MRDFVQGGGLVIAQKNALHALQNMDLAQFGQGTRLRPPNDGYLSYEEMERVRGAQVLGGAIFEVTLDLSHPLCFGFGEKTTSSFSEFFHDRSRKRK